MGHAYYTQPHLRRDTAIVGSTVVGALALLGAEGYVAEKYRETPSGREEERRAREEGALIYRHAREIVLRPGVLGGLVGLSEHLLCFFIHVVYGISEQLTPQYSVLLAITAISTGTSRCGTDAPSRPSLLVL